MSMVIAAVIAGIIFYAFMMVFGWIVVSLGRVGSNGARGWNAFAMIAFWPAWVLPEARKGDPFLITASIIFVAFAVLYTAMLLR